MVYPNNITFKNIKIISVLNNYSLQNNVLECVVLYNNCEIPVILKIERRKKRSFVNEINNINKINNEVLYNKCPIIYEDGQINNKYYLVEEKIVGENVAHLIKKSPQNRLAYLEKLGEELSLIHQISPKAFPIAKSKAKYLFNTNSLTSEELIPYINYLKDNIPLKLNNIFVHGDFHYGNILWKDNNIIGVLDWEYSGLGIKEEDIAWSILCHPNTTLFNNINDINAFLNGYKKYNNYNEQTLFWYLINYYLYFYTYSKNKSYKENILNLLKELSWK